MMTFLLIGVALAGTAWLSHRLCKLWPNDCSPEQIQTLTEVLYQIGYDDQKAGHPERSWLEGDYNPRQYQREILKAAESVYRHGRQDALEGNPSITEGIRKNREEQAQILKEMIKILKRIRAETTV
jgi:hypothetical protein